MTESAAETTHVVAAVIQRSGKYLICQRPAHKRHGGLWEFPGGKVESGESMRDAVVREVDEELGVRAESTGLVHFAAHDPGSPFTINFVGATIQDSPNTIEHAEIRWATLDDLIALPLAPTDRQFVNILAGAASSGCRLPTNREA